jgi:hypothetical protein
MFRSCVTVRGLMLLVALSALVIVCGAGTCEDRYSCHMCHNRKEVRSVTVLALPIWWRGRIETNFPFSEGHHHGWYWYNATCRGLIGGTTRYCKTRVYSDGSVAPDGCQ